MDSNKIKKILTESFTQSVFHTHVSMVCPRGKYQFNRETLEKFWSSYCEFISENSNNENMDLPVIGIAEKSQQYLPVIVDVDLKIRNEGNYREDSLYTPDQLTAVISTYQSVLRKVLEDCDSRNLTCVVLEKKMYSKDTGGNSYLKHGFHLHFPYCFLSKVDQEVHIIPRIQDELTKLNTFKNLGMENSGDVIDKACCKVPWLVYGSRKNPTSDPYIVTDIYNEECQKISLRKAFKGYQLYDNKEHLIDIKGKINYYLPRILSIIPYNRPYTKELRRGLISPLKEKMRQNQDRKVSYDHRKISTEEALRIASHLLPMLADWRVEDYSEWMTVGWVLYNVSDGDPEAMDMWCEFSARCEEKYEEKACINHWTKMLKKDLTLGTLRYYAKLDSPEQYKKYKEKQCARYIKSSLEGSHNDVAKALYAEHGDIFVCGSITNKLWFQFRNHKWEQIEEGVYLREKISSSKFLKKYVDANQKLFQEMADTNPEQEGGKSRIRGLDDNIKLIRRMIKNLKSAPFKNSVMKEASEVFYDPRFKDKIDTNPYLIAFKNGVYDLQQNIFRPGRPEDFISKAMPINYVEYTQDDEKVQDVHRFLEQVFPDREVRQYFLDTSSDVFVGGNHQKIVLFWTGEGNNGKSVTQKFFDLMLGQLSIKFDTNIVTGKKPSAGSAFADLARAGGGVRWAVFEEPNGDEMINVGILKHLSGNDSFYARDLYERGKDGREITPMFKLTFITNRLPRIRYADKATFKRIKVLPFEAEFCDSSDPAPETEEEQLRQKRFPMDKKFMQKIPSIVEAFCWVLLEHRKTITIRIEPEKVRKWTEKYHKQNDIYRLFIEENIVEDNEKEITLDHVYSIFKDWFRDSMPGNSVPVKSDVEDHLTRVWGLPRRGKRWPGYREKKNSDVMILTKKDRASYKEPEKEKEEDSDEKQRSGVQKKGTKRLLKKKNGSPTGSPPDIEMGDVNEDSDDSSDEEFVDDSDEDSSDEDSSDEDEYED